MSANLNPKWLTFVCWACETMLRGVLCEIDDTELPLEEIKFCPKCGAKYEDHPSPEGKRLWPPEPTQPVAST